MANELTPQQVELLLDRLGNDDNFRAAVSKDPAAALQSAGLPVELAACFQKAETLPTKQAAVAANQVLRAKSNVTLSMSIHKLCDR
ncbi:NHLP-related RiPP peptide [Tahibacter harae]|uniref:NHLP-related RiPP peptide n=1 Tax=Tahibacter harae TaxID=2963937 RepID=A0ABT1QTL2_9GAMM|nr:NHLP-related RiPP peptide [Tahibacter harae]MCQ4165624.1 NHLP-related RiPP peptide [Tahibacter harae]